MLSEDLEFQISQYADGSLPTGDRRGVEALLRDNPAARQVLREYQQLDVHFGALDSLPSVDWNRFAGRVSAMVDAEPSSAASFVMRPAVAGRIFSAVSNWKVRSAVAALFVCVIGGAPWVHQHKLSVNGPPTPALESVATVVGPQAEVAVGTAVQEIRVGPSPALAKQIGTWRYADGVVTHGPSNVTITAGITPAPRPDPHLR